MVLTGTEQLFRDRFRRLRGQRIGLLTNASGVTHDLTSLVELLAAAPEVELAAVFGPEHGLSAGALAGEKVGSVVHPRFGMPVHSLYGEQRAPTAEQLAGLDLLVIDLQDVGVRFFTYTSTMALALEACGRHGPPVLLLDRPNPINGLTIEGPFLDPAYSSFVGMLPAPVRHGLTLGELARLANRAFGYGADLEVLPLAGWRRDRWYDQTGLLWVLPSPNVPTLTTATVYPGACLFEGVNISEGRGTTLPFELIGAPWLDDAALAAALNDLALPGVRWRAASFTPWHGRVHVGVPCGGVQLHVTDRAKFRPFEAALHLLATARRLAPDEFAWRPPSGERGHRPIDLLAGTPSVRTALDAGVPVPEIAATWQPDLARFADERRAVLLYD